MARPGFVLEVDERTPPLLVHQGEGFRLQKFPLGSRVIYPPDSCPSSAGSATTSGMRSTIPTLANRSGSSSRRA